MKFGLHFDGQSFLCGALVARVVSGEISPLWLICAGIILFDLPGPKISYTSADGYKFRWW